MSKGWGEQARRRRRRRQAAGAHLRGVDSDYDPARLRSLLRLGGRAAAPLSLRRGPQLPDRVPLRGCCRWLRGALPAARWVCLRLLQAWPALRQRGSRSALKPAAVRPRDVHGGLHRCQESEGTGGEGSRRLGSPAALPPRAAPQSVIRRALAPGGANS